MPKILFVIHSLRAGGASKQLTLLATYLSRERHETRVCVLGRAGMFAQALQTARVAVEELGWTRLIDPAPILRLRRCIRQFQPDVIHAWGPEALRVTGFLPGRSRRLLVSDPLSRKVRALDRWLLRRVAGIVVRSQAEASRFLHAGLPAEKVQVIPPAVAPADETATQNLPPKTGPVIVCAGRFEAHKGYLDAIWALDMLRYIFPELRLWLIGEGPEEARLREFARDLGNDERVHFFGTRLDVPAILAHTDVVWILGRRENGLNVALEALAAGRPVVAASFPGLAEVLVEEAGGLLVPVGDKAALARRTRSLLESPELRDRLGAAGRARVAKHFNLADFVARYERLYAQCLIPKA